VAPEECVESGVCSGRVRRVKPAEEAGVCEGAGGKGEVRRREEFTGRLGRGDLRLALRLRGGGSLDAAGAGGGRLRRRWLLSGGVRRGGGRLRDLVAARPVLLGRSGAARFDRLRRGSRLRPRGSVRDAGQPARLATAEGRRESHRHSQPDVNECPHHFA
jgi:hypothetical protein